MSGSAWSVYIVECADGSLYTGVTAALHRRIKQHNDGRGAKYTRQRRPVKLVYAEPSADRSAAQQREAAIKRLSRQRKQQIIAAQRGAKQPLAPPDAS